MKKSNRALLASAVVAGLVMGHALKADEAAEETKPEKKAAAKGKNGCKGMKMKKHSKQDGCQGKGGCGEKKMESNGEKNPE